MTTGHLDATLLAEHAEGLLAPDEAVAVDTHLQQCETCRASAADLTSVSAMLADAPPTLPTPADVVARLDRAIADEATPAPQPAPVVELSWFRRRAPQLLAAAATVGVLGFAGWVATTSGGGDDDAAGVAESGAQDASDEAAGEESAADSDPGAAQEESAEEEAGAAPLEADDGEGYVAAAGLEDEIRAVVEQSRMQRLEGTDDTCGVPLAKELGLELVGRAATKVTGETAVLVVVQSDDPTLVYGWVVPACDASVHEALTELRVELD